MRLGVGLFSSGKGAAWVVFACHAAACVPEPTDKAARAADRGADGGPAPGQVSAGLAHLPPRPEAAPGGCEVAPPSKPDHDALVTFPVELVAGDQPFALRRPVDVRNGQQLNVTKWRFFVSAPALLTESGRWVEVQLQTARGEAEPYGLVLVDAAKPESWRLGVRAPRGRYRALSLGVGVPYACNHGDAARRVAPLNTSSEMYWPWGGLYIFMMLEGSRSPGGSMVFHMGDDKLFRFAAVEHPIRVESSQAQGPTILFDVAALYGDGPPPGASVSHGLLEPWLADNMTAGFVRVKP